MGRNKGLMKQIANGRIKYLFELAEKTYPIDKELANRYIYLVRRYAQRAKLKIPAEWKKCICQKCYSLLVYGDNCRIRMQSRSGKGSHISVTCLECNYTKRYFIKSK
ncbi:MAG: ribonuclease P [Candidatus Lokiarchaeota archaeon]|nr:ribonuclease P [Candidatus Lokiarchaeota archaeon]